MGWRRGGLWRNRRRANARARHNPPDRLPVGEAGEGYAGHFRVPANWGRSDPRPRAIRERVRHRPSARCRSSRESPPATQAEASAKQRQLLPVQDNTSPCLGKLLRKAANHRIRIRLPLRQLPKRYRGFESPLRHLRRAQMASPRSGRDAQQRRRGYGQSISFGGEAPRKARSPLRQWLCPFIASAHSELPPRWCRDADETVDPERGVVAQ